MDRGKGPRDKLSKGADEQSSRKGARVSDGPGALSFGRHIGYCGGISPAARWGHGDVCVPRGGWIDR